MALVSFAGFEPDGFGPIYVQIIRFVKQGIAAGSVCAGDELPSRRMLSALLGVNPNTAQKAYRLLEEEGLIESRSGAASYVTADGDAVARVRAELLESDARLLVGAMRRAGASREEALALITKLWEEQR